MKPYKIKNDLWFYPVQSQKHSDFNGFYFLYPENFYDLQQKGEFDPSTVDETSPFYGVVNSTMFCLGDTKVNELKKAGFKHVYNAEKFEGDVWSINGYEGAFTYQTGISGIHIYVVIGVLEQSFTQASGVSWESVIMPVAPSVPIEENGVIVSYQGGTVEIIASTVQEGYYQVAGGSGFNCAVSSEVYQKVWKDVIEAPPEVPKNTIRVYKNIYLQNGAQVKKAQTDSDPLPPAHQVSGDLWVLPCRQILNDGTEAVSDIYYQYPFKDHQYYPFEIKNNISEFGDQNFSQCTVFTSTIESYYSKWGWNGFNFNGTKLRIKDAVVDVITGTSIGIPTIKIKRPTDNNSHAITAYPRVSQNRVSGGTLFVPVSDTKICNSYYDGALNLNGDLLKMSLYKWEETIPDDEESRDFYNWLFDDRYLYDPPQKRINIYKDIFLMNGAKIYNEDGTEYKIQG